MVRVGQEDREDQEDRADQEDQEVRADPVAQAVQADQEARADQEDQEDPVAQAVVVVLVADQWDILMFLAKVFHIIIILVVVAAVPVQEHPVPLVV